MADVRALLAAERQSRRISHPHLTYTKNGALLCNVCNLNIKSEQLWLGHLRSQNHRKNAQTKQGSIVKSGKRKADEVDSIASADRDYDVASRKKPKSAIEEQALSAEERVHTKAFDEELDTVERVDHTLSSDLHQEKPSSSQSKSPVKSSRQSPAAVDEDEWAAFERDVAPLTRPDYSAAVIEAAPISAAEAEASKQEQLRSRREDEAEEERQDESRRVEEEFDYMEEMEEKVKRLRDRREALRKTTLDTQGPSMQQASARITNHTVEEVEGDAVLEPSLGDKPQDEVSSDDDAIDDWYG